MPDYGPSGAPISVEERQAALGVLEGFCLLLPGAAGLLRKHGGLPVLSGLVGSDQQPLVLRCRGMETIAALVCADIQSAEVWQQEHAIPGGGGLAQTCEWIAADGTPDALRNAALDLVSTYLASAPNGANQQQREARLNRQVGPAIGGQLAHHARKLQRHGSLASPRSPSSPAAINAAAHKPRSPSPPAPAAKFPAALSGSPQANPRNQMCTTHSGRGSPVLEPALVFVDGASAGSDTPAAAAAKKLQARWRGVRARRQYWARLEDEVAALTAAEVGQRAPVVDPEPPAPAARTPVVSAFDAARAQAEHRADIASLEEKLGELQGGLGPLVLLCEDDAVVQQLPVAAFEDAVSRLQGGLFSIAAPMSKPAARSTQSTSTSNSTGAPNGTAHGVARWQPLVGYASTARVRAAESLPLLKSVDNSGPAPAATSSTAKQRTGPRSSMMAVAALTAMKASGNEDVSSAEVEELEC
eukprot:SAG22_NODE_1514_length_4253_cov_1.546943_1_plen_471_part_00